MFGEGIHGAAVEEALLFDCEKPDCQDTTCRVVRSPIVGFNFVTFPVPFVPDEKGNDPMI